MALNNDKLIEFRESELQKNFINYNKNYDSSARNRFYSYYDFLFSSVQAKRIS